MKRVIFYFLLFTLIVSHQTVVARPQRVYHKIHVPTKIKTIYRTKIIKVPEHHHHFHEKEKYVDLSELKKHKEAEDDWDLDDYHRPAHKQDLGSVKDEVESYKPEYPPFQHDDYVPRKHEYNYGYRRVLKKHGTRSVKRHH